MNQALILNMTIVIAAIVCMACLQNPLGLPALLFLKELPYGLLVSQADDDDESKPIGFVQ